MDISIQVANLTGLFGLVSGVILAYLEAEYGKDIRSSRVDASEAMWNHLQLLTS